MSDLRVSTSERRLAGTSRGLVVRRRVPFLLPVTGNRDERWHYMLDGPGWTTLRLASDVLAAVLAVTAALLLEPSAAVGPVLLAFPPATVAMLWMRGRYRRILRAAVLDDVAPIAGAVSVAAMALLSLEVLVDGRAVSGLAIGRAWLITIPLVIAGRAALGHVQQRGRSLGRVAKPTLIVGAGVIGRQVARRLQDHPEYGLRPVGFLDADPMLARVESRDLPVLGPPEDLPELAAVTRAEHVIVAFSSAPDRGLLPLTRRCEELGLEVSLVPRFFESITDRVALERLGGLPLFGLRAVDPKGWRFRAKYMLDRPAAAIALLALAPLMALVALAVRLSSPGPIIFRQRRVGRDGKVFDLMKFRSMQLPTPWPDGFVPLPGAAPGGVEGEDRRTAVGRLLRTTGLDEMPQLINVLRGEMSLIGPRPERPEFVELFRQDIDRYADRHRVKSGITGWAQVHGLRGQTSLADRVEWDNFYIENWSLWLDCKIVMLTARAMLRSHE